MAILMLSLHLLTARRREDQANQISQQCWAVCVTFSTLSGGRMGYEKTVKDWASYD
jgi:hypothetical protein